MQRITYTLFLFALLASCDENSCNDVEFCTEQLETIFVNVQDENGTVIALDSTGTFKNEQLIFISSETEPNSPLYTVLTDLDKSEVDRSGTELTFKGWKGGETYVEESYIIGHDCCHILKVEGPETITVTLD
ncbi:hypothetical protein [Marinoscillum pacificum]|uniref:hypothetical protein n=1 Tax=Marinoscillum pacificum TaxID=392723 RepID=UPI0021586544|nr:hypothetical protein [Marinoscillum pacificum]